VSNRMWMGRPIEELYRRELEAALEAALNLLQSVPSASLVRSDVEVRETGRGTVVGRTFKWAFLRCDGALRSRPARR
jgi:hypothetical protein